jgi:hypothetical protein
MFEAPIPGQSLTTEPRNVPWENPAELSDVGEILEFYIKKLANDEVMDDIVAMLDMGASVKSVVTGLYRQGALRGIHTVDAGILVAPTLHAFIRAAATEMGAEVNDDNIDLDKRASRKEKERFIALTLKYMESGVEEDEGTDLLEEMSEALADESDAAPQEEPAMETQEEAPMGLMAKGA